LGTKPIKHSKRKRLHFALPDTNYLCFDLYINVPVMKGPSLNFKLTIFNFRDIKINLPKNACNPLLIYKKYRRPLAWR